MKTALVCDGERWSYREIENCANGLAALLSAAGIVRQDRILIFLENSVEAVLSIWGVLKAGGVFVVLNPLLKPRKFGFILRNSGASMLITDSKRLENVRSALEGAESLRQIFLCDPKPLQARTVETSGHSSCRISSFWEKIDPSRPYPRPLTNNTLETDLATLVYTSGTTGEPKGIMSAHQNVRAVIQSITSYLSNRPEDIILNLLPLSFDYGLYQALMAVAFGGTLVLEKGFGYPHTVVERVKQEQVTGFPIVPTIATLLLKMHGLRKNQFESLRYISSTGDVFPVPVIRKLRALLPHVSIFSMYGLTECKRVSYLPPDQLDKRPHSVGIPIPNEEVFVVDENGNEVPPGQVGELVIRGPNVMQGYWNAPEETAKRFRPGRSRGEVSLYSGDLFKRDEEGYLYFVARKDDMIKTKGERVSPKEIENALCEMKGVAEVAVIGVPDDILGQAIRAFVVMKKGHSLKEQGVIKYCSRNLEPFVVPKYVEFVESLPRSPNGKIDKKQLK